MVKDIQLPEISENVTSGEVINILVNVGDAVAREQTVIEVETEKAAVGIPAPIEGKVKEILVKIGDTVNVGQSLIKLDTDRKEEESYPGQPGRKTGESRQKMEAKISEPAVAQSSTATKTSATAAASSRSAISTKEEVKEPETATSAISLPPATGIAKVQETKPVSPAPASPTVRRLAREFGIDIYKVTGHGPGGRISAEDVKMYARQVFKTDEEKVSVNAGFYQPLVAELPDFKQWGTVRHEPLSKVRALTAQSMSRSWNTIPHVTQFDEADISLLNEFKSKYEKQVEKAGGKLTITAILVKVASEALKIFPQFNTSLDIDRQELIYKEYINIGLAVDTDRGLLVPVIKNADQKNLIQIAVEITELADKARHKRLGLDELKGGTFTISNLGGIGGTNFTPIINWPEVAILGMARADWSPVYRDGQWEARYILPLSLSYDHRVIDGAQGARFLHWLVGALENPFLLML